jgi:PAS domain S-box-containing protein
LKLLTHSKQLDTLKVNDNHNNQGPVQYNTDLVSLYREIFVWTTGACLLFDARGKLCDLSIKLENILGYSWGELIGRSAISLVRMLTRKGTLFWVSNPFGKTTKNGEAVREMDVYTKTGERVTLRLNSRFLRKQGRTIGRLVEVTVQNRNGSDEPGRSDPEDVYKSLVKHMGIGVFRTTPGTTGRFLEVNPAMEKITGYSREELLQMNVSDLFLHPQERGEILKKVLAGEVSEPVEVLFKKKDGTVIIVRDKKVAVSANGGNTIYFEGFLEDITERKRTEEALNLERENFRNSTEMSPLGIEIVSFEGKLIYANRTMLSLWGYSNFEEIKDIPVEQRFTPESTEKIREINESRRLGKTPVINEITIVSKDGQQRILTTYTKEIIWNDQKCVEILHEDITERKRAEEALTLERENYRNSTEMSPLGIQIINLEGKLIHVNRTMLNLWGYNDLEELKRTPQEQRFTAESLTLIRRITELRKQEKGPIQHEITIIRKDRQQRILNAYTKEIVWNGRKCSEISYEDITGRKQAEEKLRKSEIKYSLIANNTVDFIAIMTLEGKYEYLSPSHRKLGYGPEELLGKSGIDIIHPEDKQALLPLMIQYSSLQREELLDLKNDNVSKTIYYRFPDKMGKWHHMEANANLIDSTDGDGFRILMISRDLTEKKQAEEALRKQKELIDRTLKATPNAVLVMDKHLRILLANKTFKTELADGKNIEGCTLSEEIINGIVVEAVKTVVTGREKEQKVEFRTESGKKEKTYVATVIDMDEGQILLMLADITEEREKENKLYLRERLASIGEMASGIAHELNNPLTSVIGLSELLVEKSLPEEDNADVKIIHQEAMRASQIVKNLLSFARRHEPVRHPAQITEVINDVLKLRAYEQQVHNITVTSNIQSGLPYVMVDYYQMQQVFMNIVLNAEQAMIEAHNQGNLIVTVEQYGDSIRVSITDDGPGIPQENLKRVFDPFYTTKEVGKGTGLGLSVSYGIVNSHGGRIYAESEYGKGSTFIVELPAVIE